MKSCGGIRLCKPTGTVPAGVVIRDPQKLLQPSYRRDERALLKKSLNFDAIHFQAAGVFKVAQLPIAGLH